MRRCRAGLGWAEPDPNACVLKRAVIHLCLNVFGRMLRRWVNGTTASHGTRMPHMLPPAHGTRILRFEDPVIASCVLTAISRNERHLNASCHTYLQTQPVSVDQTRQGFMGLAVRLELEPLPGPSIPDLIARLFGARHRAWGGGRPGVPRRDRFTFLAAELLPLDAIPDSRDSPAVSGTMFA